MTDYDKVVKGIEYHLNGRPTCQGCVYLDVWPCLDAILKDVLALLKEQEVIPHQNYANLDMWWCECGWCLGMRETFNYCPNCGKAVKWECE